MSSAVKGARRTLQGLVWIILILFGLLTVGVATDAKGAQWTPGLGLDLKGGKQIILRAVTTDGSEITQSDMNQAVSIIRKRVDASGTSEAEITTQGSLNILVSLPGTPDEETLELVRKSAQLQFRPVLAEAQSGAISSIVPTTNPTPVPTTDTVSPTVLPATPPSSAATATPTPSAAASGIDTGSPVSEMANVKTAATPAASATPSAAPSPAPSAAPTTADVDASDLSWITPEVQAAFDALDCTSEESRAGGDVGDPAAAFVTCDAVNPVKYILGPVEMDGKDVATASSGPNMTAAGTSDGTFAVNLTMTGGGAKKFADTTARLYKLNQAGASPRDQFAMVLDGVVISAPGVRNGAITGGTASISGTFTQNEAQTLANQLKFGALPMTLDVQSEQTIAATKGASELESGMIAGLIGLILVVIYTLFQYRALGAVTIGSLLVAGGLTYVVITLLSWGIGYRLSLAGVAGLIVAIGITAD
ncbi:MAG: protein translocase subunit SecD, partial [Demequinaceae bacterium]|nr:protein translocase subunit SecD [Demequinaceae bacterium]